MKNERIKYIVFINSLPKRTEGLLKKYIKKHNKKWDYLILKQKGTPFREKEYLIDYENKESVLKFFEQYGKSIIAITARSEGDIPLFQRIIPYVPQHILVPTVESLTACLEKTKMRKAFSSYDKSITPKFAILSRFDQQEIDSVVQKIDFPVIVKPSGLASSLLVQAAYYPEELKTILTQMFKKIDQIYQKKKGRGKPEVLIEEFIEGNVYSVDAHINNDGEIFFNPFIKYKVAVEKGFDDFFIYEVSAPCGLTQELIENAQKVAQKGIKALGLKNSSAHIELIYKNNSWKLIEIGARVGGNRSTLYKKTFGINIDINDILIRMNKKISTQKKHIGYSSILKIYPKNEGYIKKIKGLKRIKKFSSVSKIIPHLKVGDKSLFAKNGGENILKINLFNKDKIQLLADKRKVEKTIEVETSKTNKFLL
jgi:biotin carboxylase